MATVDAKSDTARMPEALLPLKTLLVDDEPLARRGLEIRLANEADIRIVAQCGNGEEAVRAVAEHEPDLMFLDVQMPGLDGFATLRAIPASRMPLVVFVTAYDHYAIRAFDVHALDYLLKPFDEERLERAVERARRAIVGGRTGSDERLLALLREIRPARRYIERITIREKARVFFQPVREIDWLEADGKYVRVHAGSAVHTIRDGIGRIHGELDPDRFIRISRSAIVNIDRIVELRPWFQGDYLVVIAGGRQIPSTRGYRDALLALLDGRR